jgi:hypothetical protein
MGSWICKGCGRPEFGWSFWRVRNAGGGHVCDTSSLAQARRYLRTYPWAKGAKIYRVTWSRKRAACYAKPGDEPTPFAAQNRSTDDG